MNAAAVPGGYQCEALAVEFFGGEMASYVLGTFRTVSPVLAMRWLGGQALWIADRIGADADADSDPDSDPDSDLGCDPDRDTDFDSVAGADLGPWPDPARSAWAQPLTRLPVGSTADRPAELRAWYEDRQSQRAAQAHIKNGHPFLVVVPDTDCTYTLSVHPD
ncbi:hypothetical protein [Streptomyces sp. NPDC088731]|uniref:hypothetical protein n=1 Tax=Streptomyces sp. NPDC088731 TaxID=3365878 RepID=UPI00381170D8